MRSRNTSVMLFRQLAEHVTRSSGAPFLSAFFPSYRPKLRLYRFPVRPLSSFIGVLVTMAIKRFPSRRCKTHSPECRICSRHLPPNRRLGVASGLEERSGNRCRALPPRRRTIRTAAEQEIVPVGDHAVQIGSDHRLADRTPRRAPGTSHRARPPFRAETSSCAAITADRTGPVEPRYPHREPAHLVGAAARTFHAELGSRGRSRYVSNAAHQSLPLVVSGYAGTARKSVDVVHSDTSNRRPELSCICAELRPRLVDGNDGSVLVKDGDRMRERIERRLEGSLGGSLCVSVMSGTPFSSGVFHEVRLLCGRSGDHSESIPPSWFLAE